MTSISSTSLGSCRKRKGTERINGDVWKTRKSYKIHIQKEKEPIGGRYINPNVLEISYYSKDNYNEEEAIELMKKSRRISRRFGWFLGGIMNENKTRNEEFMEEHEGEYCDMTNREMIKNLDKNIDLPDHVTDDRSLKEIRRENDSGTLTGTDATKRRTIHGMLTVVSVFMFTLIVLASISRNPSDLGKVGIVLIFFFLSTILFVYGFLHPSEM